MTLPLSSLPSLHAHFPIELPAHFALVNTMNRKKKVIQTQKSKIKKQNAKLHRSNKPRYISKAERAKMEAEAQQSEGQASDATETVTQPDNNTAAE